MKEFPQGYLKTESSGVEQPDSSVAAMGMEISKNQ
jgi:hypothetical protein